MGSNRILFVGVTISQTGSTVTVTGITYNGVALTQVNTSAASTNRRADLWYLIAPATGANNVIVTLSGIPDGFFNAGVGSYTGAAQGSQPEASGVSGVPNASATTTTAKSLTTLTDNAWMVACAVDGAAANPVIDAGSFFRLSVYNRTGNGYELYFLDSNGAKTPVGSYSIGYTHNSTGSDIVAAVIRPNDVSFSISDTALQVTDSASVVTGYAVTVSDSETTTDTAVAKIGWNGESKSTAPTWTNEPKS